MIGLMHLDHTDASCQFWGVDKPTFDIVKICQMAIRTHIVADIRKE